MRFSKAVVKYRVAILIVALALLAPAVLGMVNTRINYDMLDYLPEDMDTVIGQNELLNDFGHTADHKIRAPLGKQVLVQIRFQRLSLGKGLANLPEYRLPHANGPAELLEVHWPHFDISHGKRPCALEFDSQHRSREGVVVAPIFYEKFRVCGHVGKFLYLVDEHERVAFDERDFRQHCQTIDEILRAACRRQRLLGHLVA